MARSWLISCALGASLALGSHARAEGRSPAHAPSSSLSWVRLAGAESCISTQALARGIEERLDRKLFVSASDADLSVEGHVERTDGAWIATVHVRDAQGKDVGTRMLESRDATCEALGKQLVFTLSVMIESTLPPKESPPTNPERIVEKKTVFVKVPVAAPPGERPEARPPWRFGVDAGLAAGVGLLPAPSLGAKASVAIMPPRFWPIELSGSYWFDQTVTAERGAGADIAMAYGSLAICPLDIARDHVFVRGCAGGNLGSLRVRGVGFDTPLAGENLLAQAMAGGRFGLRIAGPLFATAALELIVPITRDELIYRAADNSERQLYRSAPIAAAGSLGLGVVFP